MSKVRSKVVKPSGSRLDVENPFTNSLVLTNIFEHSSVGTLKACRLVSKQWLDSSTTAWRKKAVLKVYGMGSKMKRAQISYYRGGLVDGNKLSGQPFRKYNLMSWNFIGMGGKRRINYWISSGPFVTQLRLTSCRFGVTQLDTLLFSDLFPNLKTLELKRNVFQGRLIDRLRFVPAKLKSNAFNLEKLHSLTLGLRRDDFDQDHAIFPMTYKNFFERIPNIKVLTIDAKHEYNDFAVDELIELLEDIVEIRERDGRDKLDIEDLDIINVGSHGLENYHGFLLDRFKNLGWALKTLKMDIGFEGAGHRMSLFLQPFVQHLEELTLFRIPCTYPHNLPFDFEMPNLRILRLLGVCHDSFHFLKYLPGLKVLHLFTSPVKGEVTKIQNPEPRDDYDGSDSDSDYDYAKVYAQIFFTGDMVIEKTSQLVRKIKLEAGVAAQVEELQGDFLVKDSKNFRKLIKWLPNLRKLRLPLTRRTFPVVCRQWRHSLRELFIPEGCDLDDKAFTGSKWNITSLTNLTHLTVGVKDRSRQDFGVRAAFPQLTEVALTHGIQLLPELRTLLMVMSTTKISKSKLKLLKSKIENLELWGFDAGELELRRLA